jgi:hypothetical protein
MVTAIARQAEPASWLQTAAGHVEIDDLRTRVFSARSVSHQSDRPRSARPAAPASV